MFVADQSWDKALTISGISDWECVGVREGHASRSRDVFPGGIARSSAIVGRGGANVQYIESAAGWNEPSELTRMASPERMAKVTRPVSHGSCGLTSFPPDL